MEKIEMLALLDDYIESCRQAVRSLHRTAEASLVERMNREIETLSEIRKIVERAKDV